jgi:hypothetical protein
MLPDMKKLILFIALFTSFAFSQKNTTDYIQAIESGKQESVRKIIEQEVQKHPDDPDLLYVSALIAQDGDAATKLYARVIESKKKCPYTDAAYFKLWQYYYAQGLYSKADTYKSGLEKKFPDSKYVHLFELKESKVTEDASAPPKSGVLSGESTKQTSQVHKAAEGPSVQVGAFSKKENAKEIVKRLSDPTLSVSISEKNVGGTVFYIVTAAGFADSDAANAYVERINKKFSLQSRVINR